MRNNLPRQTIVLTLLSLVLVPQASFGQQPEPKADDKTPKRPEISDEPKFVDPATLVPAKLAVNVTIDFDESSLREIAAWIQQEQKIPVLFDRKALSDENIALGETVTDGLKNEPLYLLLNRLRSLGLSWYVADDILHITTLAVADRRMSTESYNVSDLLDTGFKVEDLTATILSTAGGAWMEVDGAGGTIEWLGDVLFVRQTARAHQEVAGLLTALRKHGRRTLTFDPPQHARLREALDANISVDFSETPLARAIEQLSEQSGVAIRLDTAALRESGIRDREPVSLTLSDRKLQTVLHVLLSDVNLTWILRDGVMGITSIRRAGRHEITAIYDVRDLCRNQDEAYELTEAIQTQTAGPWEETDGDGGTITFARTGTMAIRHTESGLREVSALLQTYRTALLNSKPRKRDVVDPTEVITRYYRLHAGVAEGLVELLPHLVEPTTWKNAQQPDAVGTILKVVSSPELTDAQGHAVQSGTGEAAASAQALVVARAVLIVRQSRAVHDTIAETITRIENGDPRVAEDLEGGGMGGMGGGFGGGYFSVPQEDATDK